MNEVALPQGTVRYRESGEGAPIVFVHGLLVNGTLWRKVVPELERDFRCIVPDLPLGSHSQPVNRDADLSPRGLAQLLADFLAALELDDVTLVGNDTGGAICQITAAHHSERLGRLVLTPCDAYENFLPPMFRPLQYAARVPGLLNALVKPTRFAAVRRSPLGFGMLVKRPIPDEVTDAWLRPFRSSRGIRRDAEKVLRGIHPRHTIEAAERLRSFGKPVLIAWAPEDRTFKLKYAQRLAADIPTARIETIDDSSTFVSEDQPQRVAELVAAFAREPRGVAA